MPVSLGEARGSIGIDTQGVTNAERVVKRSSANMTKDMAGIGTGVNKAGGAFAGLTNIVRQFSGAFGLSLGAAGVVQLGRMALEAEALATAYNRQQVAAVSLAGSQERLNDLLRTYDEATGGAIDKATALADVTKLQAIGFANTAEELDRFARAARGIAVAMGVSQDFVISQLTLAIANQSFLRLDQIGLDAAEAKKAIDQLKASTSGLTDAQIYQQAILEQAEKKFGTLADSVEAQATGAEKLTKAWKDLRLEMGQEIKPSLDETTNALTDLLNLINRVREANKQRTGEALGRRVAEESGTSRTAPSFLDRPPAWMTSATGFAGPPPAAAGKSFTDEQIKISREHNEAIEEIERDSNNSRLESTRSYNEQVSSTERDYQQTISREAQDFATSRLRQEADFAESILDIRRDAGRREVDQAEDLARTIARSERDSSERIADAREDTAERLAELDENFKRDQEKREEDFKDDMLSAAGRLDAIALLELRKDRAKNIQEAKEAHEEQRSDLEEQLQERIDDENEALAKSIANAQEAHDRQLADAREADELRIADMKADFEERKVLEDADRALRLARLAEDHQNKLNEMARQHALDMQQLATNEADKRAQEQKAFEAALAEEGIRNNRWLAEDRRRTDAAIAHLEEISLAISRLGMPTFGPAPLNPMITPGQWPSLLGGGGTASSTQARTTTNSRVVNIEQILITGDGLNEQQVVDILIRELENG